MAVKRFDGWWTDGGHEDLKTVVKHAKERGHHIFVMRDRKTKRYHLIEPFGHAHWLKHYDDVYEITFVPKVKKLQAPTAQSRTERKA